MTKISYQGERGAYSEIAAKKFFGKNIELFPAYSFNDAFVKVKKGEVDFGILPVENTLYGSIFETYDYLLKYSLKITGEINLQINHYLISDKKYQLNEIKKVYSHPQALGQCSEFLKTLKNAKIIPSYDTAGAVKSLTGSKEPSAAIASNEAAEIYKMNILRSKIQNSKQNITRFLIISKKESNGKKYKKPKSSICFELENLPGALFKSLSVFALRDIDLAKIESRPIPHKPFQYMFYVDLFGDLSDKKIDLAIKHLQEISVSVKEFGTYEAGKLFKS